MPLTIQYTTDRARIVALQALVGDVLAGVTPVDILVPALLHLHRDLQAAVQQCEAADVRGDARAFFDTNRMAYLRARAGVARMLLACEDPAPYHSLPPGLRALESAVADVEALVALEAEAPIMVSKGLSQCAPC